MSASSRKAWSRILFILALLILLFLLGEFLLRPRVFRHSLASSDYRRGSYSQAERTWKRVQDAKDGDPIPEASLGKLQYKRGDYAQARQRLEESLREKDKFPGSHYDLGNVLYRSEDLDAALEQYKKAMLLDPGDKDAKSNYELVLRRKGYQPPPQSSGEQEEQQKQPQTSPQNREQYENTLNALDQKEARERNRQRSKAPAKEGKWW